MKTISLKKILLVFLLLLTALKILPGQNDAPGFSADSERKLRFMFYNVENAFDTINNPDKEDNEFLPDTIRGWDSYKYYRKINKIYKVTIAAGGWQPPDLIGICEIENGNVIQDLISKTPLSKYPYEFAHKNSPDERGIDVAILYNTEKVEMLSADFIKIELPPEYRSTRDILYAKVTDYKEDTLHIFVNHWPSRWGGAAATEQKRIIAAQTLRKTTDSILKTNSDSKIIITGDFNDEPENASLTEHLKALSSYNEIQSNNLYNLSANWQKRFRGTHKYQEHWSVLDQFIVSGALLLDKDNLHTTPEDACIFEFSPLLEKDKKHMGVKPYRTFYGYKYHGGYSDHLPILLDLH
ncbi:MAG: endonuclease/exonuclease/phosphatase family protein [Bacteroidales bacterium]